MVTKEERKTNTCLTEAEEEELKVWFNNFVSDPEKQKMLDKLGE